MTSKERIMAVMNGKEPDRIPWAPLIDEYFTSSLIKDGSVPGIVEVLKDIGADIIRRHTPAFKRVYKNVEFKVENDGDDELRSIITPVGTLYQSYKYSGKTKFTSGHMIATAEDVKIMQYVFENMNFENLNNEFLKEQELIGEDGIAAVSAEPTPVQKLLQYEMGIEGFTYMLYDNEDIIEELMETIHFSNLRLLATLIDSPADVIISYEDTSSTVLSRKWYEKYCSDKIDEYAELVIKSGKIYISHMCGKISAFIDLIKKNKMCGLDSICPPDTGDLCAADALREFEGKFVIGGIDPAELVRMSEDETEQYVINILKSVAPGKRFILSTGDATAHGTPYGNLKKITEVIKKYGSYPLKET